MYTSESSANFNKGNIGRFTMVVTRIASPSLKRNKIEKCPKDILREREKERERERERERESAISKKCAPPVKNFIF